MSRFLMLGLSAVPTLLAQPATAQLKTQPAPRGDPAEVALAAIGYAEHSCPKVTAARRNADGSILARCSNREEYLVFRIRGYHETVAAKCSAAVKFGIDCNSIK